MATTSPPKFYYFVQLGSKSWRIKTMSLKWKKLKSVTYLMELEKDNFVESVRDLPFSRLILLWGTYFSVFTHFTKQMISIYVFYLPFTNVFESSKYRCTRWEFQSWLKYVKCLWKRMSLYIWPLYDHFWPFICHLYVHLSQNWGSDGHFEVLNRSKSWLVQKLWPQM